MAMSKEDILEAVGAMSVMELNDLVKAFEEKFGVSAAAMVLQVLLLQKNRLNSLLFCPNLVLTRLLLSRPFVKLQAWV